MPLIHKSLSDRLDYIFGRKGRAYRRLLRLRAALAVDTPFSTCADAAGLCAEMRWPFRVQHNARDARCGFACVACTPYGLVFFLSHGEPKPDGSSRLPDPAARYQKDHTDMKAFLRGLPTPLPDGATPLLVHRGTMHQHLEWIDRWTIGQEGLDGWTGEVHVAPENLYKTMWEYLPGSAPDRLGSCILVVHQDGLAVLLFTGIDQTAGWFQKSGSNPLSACRVSKVFSLA